MCTDIEAGYPVSMLETETRVTPWWKSSLFAVEFFTKSTGETMEGGEDGSGDDDYNDRRWKRLKLNKVVSQFFDEKIG